MCKNCNEIYNKYVDNLEIISAKYVVALYIQETMIKLKHTKIDINYLKKKLCLL